MSRPEADDSVWADLRRAVRAVERAPFRPSTVVEVPVVAKRRLPPPTPVPAPGTFALDRIANAVRALQDAPYPVAVRLSPLLWEKLLERDRQAWRAMNVIPVVGFTIDPELPTWVVKVDWSNRHTTTVHLERK